MQNNSNSRIFKKLQQFTSFERPVLCQEGAYILLVMKVFQARLKIAHYLVEENICAKCFNDLSVKYGCIVCGRCQPNCHEVRK